MNSGTEQDRSDYWRARDWLTYAVHELPLGVLGGPNSATESECAELMQELEDFERLCARLGIEDHQAFIEGCRWHFEHYAHYLGRRRHFDSYATYTEARHGPLQVDLPPSPPRWLHRT